nr:hypothetical protein GCM10020092_065450 [Actinoplanes digitatis]
MPFTPLICTVPAVGEVTVTVPVDRSYTGSTPSAELREVRVTDRRVRREG